MAAEKECGLPYNQYLLGRMKGDKVKIEVAEPYKLQGSENIQLAFCAKCQSSGMLDVVISPLKSETKVDYGTLELYSYQMLLVSKVSYPE